MPNGLSAQTATVTTVDGRDRILDKLIDEPAKGKTMEKILR
jgi:hypothetical protein